MARAIFRFLKIPLFIWAVFTFDTFVFPSAITFFNLWDLPLLKRLNKRVVVIFHGTDARPPYINGKFFDDLPEECLKATMATKNRVRAVERYADIVVNHPPTAHFHERPFVRYMSLGMPLKFADSPPALVGASKAVRIVHAPTHTGGKGTSLIRAAIERLKQKGHPIEYVEIINMPNAVVLDELSRCDFVVDELYSDAVMAKFATEAAFYGKPAIVGGYATAQDWGGPPEDVPPVFHCHPDAFEQAIEELIVNESARKKLGEQAKRFVDEYWSAKAVAERFMQILGGDYPSDWLCDPSSITYLHGWGLTEAKVQQLVERMVTNFGVSSLQLEDKPQLVKRFLDFIGRQAS